MAMASSPGVADDADDNDDGDYDADNNDGC